MMFLPAIYNRTQTRIEQYYSFVRVTPIISTNKLTHFQHAIRHIAVLNGRNNRYEISPLIFSAQQSLVKYYAHLSSASFAYEVIVSNPPPAQNDYTPIAMVPDENYKMYPVNVEECMKEELAPYDLHAGVIFELYTLHNPKERQILNTNDTRSLAASNFNASRPTRFVVHGWNTNGGVTTAFQNGSYARGF